jgi:hypothetical protein
LNTMSQNPAWKSIIRFQDSAGVTRYGEPAPDLKRAQVYEGQDLLHLSAGSDVVDVAEVSSQQRSLNTSEKPWRRSLRRMCQTKSSASA